MDLEATRAAVAEIRSMQLRSGSVVGGSSGTLSSAGRELFEEGVALVFQRWTALCLAIQEQWGGQSSAEKAEDLYTDVLEWFGKSTVHHADDLELLMTDQLLADFSAQIEDGSPREVAKQLICLHHDLMQQKTDVLNQLRLAGTSGASASQRQQVDLDGTALNAEVDDTSSDDDEDMSEAANGTVHFAQPMIDEDGFQLVQSKGKNRAPQASRGPNQL